MGAKTFLQYFFFVLAGFSIVYAFNAILVLHDGKEAFMYFVIACLCVKHG